MHFRQLFNIHRFKFGFVAWNKNKSLDDAGVHVSNNVMQNNSYDYYVDSNKTSFKLSLIF